MEKEQNIDEQSEDQKSSTEKTSENLSEVNQEDKIKELEDKLTRSLAEMENQRRRYEKERGDAFEYGGYSLAKEVLGVLDNLERSKQSIESDKNLNDEKSKKKIIEHLDIIYKDVISIFKKNNIEIIDCMNKKLDPNIHQAMIEIENDDKDQGIVVQEIQKGFMMKDRLLRPSLVGVSKKSQKIDNKDKKSEENEEN